MMVKTEVDHQGRIVVQSNQSSGVQLSGVVSGPGDSQVELFPGAKDAPSTSTD